MEDFRDSFGVVVNWIKGSDMEFDLIGIDPAIANALRRILIAELPTVAIEHVFYLNNTSIITVNICAAAVTLLPMIDEPAISQ